MAMATKKVEMAGDVAVGFGTNGRFNPHRPLAFLRARRLSQQLIGHADQCRRFSQNLLDGAGDGHSTQRGCVCAVHVACVGDIFVRNGRFAHASAEKLENGTGFNPPARRSSASRRRRYLRHHPQSGRVCTAVFTPLSGHFCGLFCHLVGVGDCGDWAKNCQLSIVNYQLSMGGNGRFNPDCFVRFVGGHEGLSSRAGAGGRLSVDDGDVGGVCATR